MGNQTAGRLILMRHAKSTHDVSVPSDHARPLAKRGRRDTPQMATWLAEQHGLPERILCSDSARTRETADLLLQTWHGLANTPIPEIKFLAELYHADPHDIVESLRRFHGGRSSLMVIAHNPGISEYATRLCGQPISMPTAAIAIFSGPAAEPDDSDVSSFETLSLRSRWSLAGFTTPKSLTGARK